MFGKRGNALDPKWLRLFLVAIVASMVALSGCTFRSEVRDDENDNDNDVGIGDDDAEDDNDGRVRGEGSPGLAGIAVIGALGAVAVFARRRLQ